MNRYEQLAQIGKGAFGVVYKSRMRQTGQLVALKQVSTYGRTKQEIQALRQEIDLLRALDHPYIIKFLEFFEEDGNIIIVTEMAQSDLFDIATADGRLGVSTLQLVAFQVLTALKFMHSLHIAHRDIKAQNILVAGGTCKLADFGFAKQSAGDDVFTSIKGTPLYLAPEVLSGKPYDGCLADIWSLGVMLFELACGSPPFRVTDLATLIKQLQDPALQIPYSSHRVFSDHPHLKAMLSCMLQRDPENRLDAVRLLQHPFLNEGNRTLIVAKGPSLSGPAKDWYKILQKVREEAALQRLQLRNAIYSSTQDLASEIALGQVRGKGESVGVSSADQQPAYFAQISTIPSIKELVQHCIGNIELGKPATALLEMLESTDNFLPLLTLDAVQDLALHTDNEFYLADYSSLVEEASSSPTPAVAVQQCYDRAVDYLSFLLARLPGVVSAALGRVGSLLESQDCGLMDQVFLALYLRFLAVLSGCSFSRRSDLRFGPSVEFPFNFQIEEEVAVCPSSPAQPVVFTPRAHVQAAFVYTLVSRNLVVDLQNRLSGALTFCLRGLSQGITDRTAFNCAVYNVIVAQKILTTLFSASQFVFRDYRLHLGFDSRVVQKLEGEKKRDSDAGTGQAETPDASSGPAEDQESARDIDYDITFGEPYFGRLLTRDGDLERYLTPAQANFGGSGGEGGAMRSTAGRSSKVLKRGPPGRDSARWNRPLLLSAWRGRASASIGSGFSFGSGRLSRVSDKAKHARDQWNYTSIHLTDKLVLYAEYFVSLLAARAMKEIPAIFSLLYGVGKIFLSMQNGIQLDETYPSVLEGFVQDCLSTLYEEAPRRSQGVSGAPASLYRSSMTHGLPSTSTFFRQSSLTPYTHSTAHTFGSGYNLDSSFADRATPIFGSPAGEQAWQPGPTFAKLSAYSPEEQPGKTVAGLLAGGANSLVSEDLGLGASATRAPKSSCLPLKAPVSVFEVFLEIRISAVSLFLAFVDASDVLLPGQMMRFGDMAPPFGFYRPENAFSVPTLGGRGSNTSAGKLQMLATLTSRAELSAMLYNDNSALGAYIGQFRRQLSIICSTLPLAYPFPHDEGMDAAMAAAWPSRIQGLPPWEAGGADSSSSVPPSPATGVALDFGVGASPSGAGPSLVSSPHPPQLPVTYKERDGTADVRASREASRDEKSPEPLKSSASGEKHASYPPLIARGSVEATRGVGHASVPGETEYPSTPGRAFPGVVTTEDASQILVSSHVTPQLPRLDAFSSSVPSTPQVFSTEEFGRSLAAREKLRDDKVFRTYHSLMRDQLGRLKRLSVRVLSSVCGPQYQRLFPVYSLVKRSASPLHDSALHLREASRRLALENGDEIQLRAIKGPNLRAAVEYLARTSTPLRGALLAFHPEIAYYINGQGVPQRYFSSVLLMDPLSPDKMYQSTCACVSFYLLSSSQDVPRSIVAALLEGGVLSNEMVSSVFLTRFVETYAGIFRGVTNKQPVARGPETVLYQGLPCKAYVYNVEPQAIGSASLGAEKAEYTVDHSRAEKYMQDERERGRIRLLTVLYRCASVDQDFLSKLVETRFLYENTSIASEDGESLSFCFPTLLLISVYWLYSHSEEEDLRLSLLSLMFSRNFAGVISNVAEDGKNIVQAFGLKNVHFLLLRSFFLRYASFSSDFAQQIRESNSQLEARSAGSAMARAPAQVDVVTEDGEVASARDVQAGDSCACPGGFVIRPGALQDYLEYDSPTVAPASYLSYASDIGCRLGESDVPSAKGSGGSEASEISGAAASSSTSASATAPAGARASALADICIDAALYHDRRPVNQYFSPYFLGTGALVSIPVGANYREQEISTEALYAGLEVFLGVADYVYAFTAEDDSPASCFRRYPSELTDLARASASRVETPLGVSAGSGGAAASGRGACLAELRALLLETAEAVSRALFYSLDLCLVEPVVRPASPPTQGGAGILDGVVMFAVEFSARCPDILYPLFCKLSMVLNLCCDNSVAEAFGSVTAPPHHGYSDERHAGQKPCPTAIHCAILNNCLDCLRTVNTAALPPGEAENLASACATLSASQPQWRHFLGPRGVYLYSHAVVEMLKGLRGKAVPGLDYDVLGPSLRADKGPGMEQTTTAGEGYTSVNYALFPASRGRGAAATRAWPMREICRLLTLTCSQHCVDSILMSPVDSFGGLDAAERVLASALAAIGALEQRTRQSGARQHQQRASLWADEADESDWQGDPRDVGGLRSRTEVERPGAAQGGTQRQGGAADAVDSNLPSAFAAPGTYPASYPTNARIFGAIPATEDADHLGLEVFGFPDMSPLFGLASILLDYNFIGQSLGTLTHMESRLALFRPLLAVFCRFALSSAEQVSIPWCVQLAASDFMSLNMMQLVFVPRASEQQNDLRRGVLEYCTLLARIASLHPLFADLAMEILDYSVLNSVLSLGAPEQAGRDEESEFSVQRREPQARHEDPLVVGRGTETLVVSGCKLLSALVCHNSIYHLALKPCISRLIDLLSAKSLWILEAACSAIQVFASRLPCCGPEFADGGATASGGRAFSEAAKQQAEELEAAIMPIFPRLNSMLLDARNTDATKAQLVWCAAVLASKSEELLEGAWQQEIPQTLMECIENCSSSSGGELLLMAQALERFLGLSDIQRRMARNRHVIQLRRILEKRKAVRSPDPAVQASMVQAYRVLRGVASSLSRARK